MRIRDWSSDVCSSDLLSLALAYERDNAPSLEGFLHWLSAGELEIKRDLEQEQGAVRLMTVHGAKGLEAPVVILPDTLQLPNAPDGLLWVDDGKAKPPLAVWPVKRRSEEHTSELQSLLRIS